MKCFAAKPSGKETWRFSICLDTRRPNAASLGHTGKALTIKASGSLLCWKFHQPLPQKQQCGCQLLPMQENPKTSLERAMSRLESALTPAIQIAEALRENGQNHTSEFALARSARESLIRDSISESCEEWVKSGSLPLMSAEDALFFYDRLFYGFAMARLLHKSGFEWNGSDGGLLSWLLTQSWVRISCLLWKASLEAQS